MCIAIINTAEGMPITRKTFERCWHNNPHGAGIAASINGKLVIEKDLKDWNRLWKIYRTWREDKSLNIMLHFRISTHGSRSLDNCHPFMVNKELAFCHNGIINQVDTSNDKSDTVAFNEQYLRDMPKNFAFNPAIKQLLLDRIGYSKLVFLTADNRYSIVGEKRGVWDNGNWYSNDTYKPVAYIDYGGIKVSKSGGGSYEPQKTKDKPLRQTELFYDGEDDSTTDYDALDSYGFYNPKRWNYRDPEKCYECENELHSKLAKNYGYCDTCLRSYGVLPDSKVGKENDLI